MDFNEYQKEARKLDLYPKKVGLISHALGLANESGEVLGKIKKQIRDNDSNFNNLKFKYAVAKELGDTLWYLANLAKDLDIKLENIANNNIIKLLYRQSEGKLKGSGDDR